MIKIGLAATNDAAGLDNKNVSAFIELAQKKRLRGYKRRVGVFLSLRKLKGLQTGLRIAI